MVNVSVAVIGLMVKTGMWVALKALPMDGGKRRMPHV
jgi:hypothetical protein